MKKNIIQALLLGAMLSACGEKFLDLQPVSNVTTERSFKTQKDIDLAVNGAYAALLMTGQFQEYYNFGELPADNVNKPGTGDQNDFNAFTVRPVNAYLSRAWADHYAGIGRCNTVLARIDAVPLDDAVRSRYIAQAKFLRALMYFNLVRYFGAVPVVTGEIVEVNDGYAYDRRPVAEVYAQIVKDLTEADNVLPAAKATEFGRATRGAVKALLAKVHLTQRNFAAAAAVAKEVIDQNDYALVPDYATLFQAATENNPEVVFAAQFKSGVGQGSSFPQWFGPLSASVFGAGSNGRGDMLPTPEMVRAYEAGDKRKTVSVDSLVNKDGSVTRYTKKFPNGHNDSDNNWPILRYADVLLMYAEALNETGYQAGGDAFKYLNEVRKRAGLGEKTATDLPDQASFRAAVEQERRVELAFEGHRWFDLVRTNRAVEVINAKAKPLGVVGTDNSGQIDAENLVFPIPQGQIDLNPERIWQNDGYL
jgi:hypothetical protein